MSEVLDRIEERGIKKGIEMGRLEMLYSLVNDGVIDAEEAAKRAGKTVKAFNEGMKSLHGEMN